LTVKLTDRRLQLIIHSLCSLGRHTHRHSDTQGHVRPGEPRMKQATMQRPMLALAQHLRLALRCVQHSCGPSARGPELRWGCQSAARSRNNHASTCGAARSTSSAAAAVVTDVEPAVPAASMSGAAEDLQFRCVLIVPYPCLTPCGCGSPFTCLLCSW